jgi:hypothetical protein
MNNSLQKEGPDQDLKSLLKSQQKRIYSLCRFFANNYREQQKLFADIISAASQNIRFRRSNENKQLLVLRACVNMAALHSICQDMQPNSDRSIQFKSPDYQKNMVQFRARIGHVSDYEKMRFFLGLQNIADVGIEDLTGPLPSKVVPTERVKRNFIPYLKDILVWS